MVATGRQLSSGRRRALPRLGRPESLPLSEVEWVAVSTWSVVTLEQIASARLAALKNLALRVTVASASKVGAISGKSLASRGFQLHQPAGHESPDQSNCLNYESA
jgi:hypothetical protein